MLRLSGQPGGVTEPDGGRLRFRRRYRLTHDRQFQAVFNAKLRKSRGPLTLWAKPNGMDEPRLGLSVGRRVGGAVVRNRLKRRLREAFRLERPRLPGGEDGSYDLIIGARSHEPLGLDEYRRLLRELAEAAHQTHQRRLERSRHKATEESAQESDP